MNRAHREVYTKGKAKLDHLAADRLDPCRKPLTRSNNKDGHPERTDRVRAVLRAREEKRFLERSPKEANAFGLLTKCAAVASVPRKLGGAGLSRLRMPVAAVFENLQEGSASTKSSRFITA
jgi:hypothetical protein